MQLSASSRPRWEDPEAEVSLTMSDSELFAALCPGREPAADLGPLSQENASESLAFVPFAKLCRSSVPHSARVDLRPLCAVLCVPERPLDRAVSDQSCHLALFPLQPADCWPLASGVVAPSWPRAIGNSLGPWPLKGRLPDSKRSVWRKGIVGTRRRAAPGFPHC